MDIVNSNVANAAGRSFFVAVTKSNTDRVACVHCHDISNVDVIDRSTIDALNGNRGSKCVTNPQAPNDDLLESTMGSRPQIERAGART